MNILKVVEQEKETLLRHKMLFSSIPEIGFNEYKTSQFICNELKEYGYNVISNISGTGVLGVLEGNNSEWDECILFRADMDALVIQDENGNEKISHVCGHDAHMAIILALARIIARNKDNLKGNIKFLFQPAEETMGGAVQMISNNVLENPKVTKAFGIHVWSEFKVGEIAINHGPVMAGGDELSIDVIGKGGHGALPESAIDTIIIASNIVNAFQTIISRNINPLEHAVISIGTINGGKSKNSIAELTKITGTCRYYSEEIQALMINRIESIALGYAKSFGGNAKVKYVKKHPPLNNWKEEVDVVKKIAKDIVGRSNVIEEYRSMCVEDFSYYLKEVPGCFIFLGCRDGMYYPQHNNNYYVADDALIIGLQLLYNIALNYLF